MPLTVLVGADDREPSADAIELGLELAADGGSLHIAAVLPYEAVPYGVAAYEQALNEHYARIFERVDAQVGSRPYTAHRPMSSSPPRALAELAEDVGAGVVVIGSTERSRIGRILPGSVGDRLLAGSALPVAIAPRGYATDSHTVERIGVGFDGREESGVALAFASFLSQAVGVPLKLLAVLAPPAPALAQIAPDLGYEETVRSELEAVLEAGEQAVAAPGTTTEILVGEPAIALAEASAGLDLLIVGSRGYGPLRRVLLGDVSAKLVREVQCPAIVVPRAFSDPIGVSSPG